tara:strand:+ start:1200 stop:2159 length:960 start_codon:yes stop_codon:yes gene_type:complete
MRIFPILCSVLGLVASAASQNLRKGLVRADAVVVARQVGKKAHGEQIALHRLQIIQNVRGAAEHKAVTVLDWPKLSLHQRPTPRQSRLYCLQDASAAATRMGLAASEGPYFKMTGWAGSNPLIGKDLTKDPIVRFANVLADSETGTAPDITASTLAGMAISAEPVVRTEIARFLGERTDLRGKLSSMHWTQLVARAAGEMEDIEYKIALAELCAAQRLDGLLDALAVSLGPVQDVRFARCVGRIGKALYGEEATSKLTDRLKYAGQQQDRKMLLLAIGATNTKSALDALLQMDRTDAAVTAALKEHHSPRAKEAAGRRK